MLSIITTTYNDYSLLKGTLDSLEKLSGTELLVVNGGTCKRTADMLKTRGIRNISEPDGGIADAYNKGVRHTTGDSLLFLNSGDLLIDKNYLKLALDILENNPQYSFVHSNLLFNDQCAGPIILKPKNISLGMGMPYLHPTMVVRRSVFDQIGGFNTQYTCAGDFDFIVRMEKAKLKGYYLDSNAVVEMDGGGVSVSKEIVSIWECYRSLRDHNLLTISNRFWFMIRLNNYYVRRVLGFSKLGRYIVKCIKRFKHRG